MLAPSWYVQGHVCLITKGYRPANIGCHSIPPMSAGYPTLGLRAVIPLMGMNNLGVSYADTRATLVRGGR